MSELFLSEPNFWSVSAMAWIVVGGTAAIVGAGRYLGAGEESGALIFWAGLLFPLTVLVLLFGFLYLTARDALEFLKDWDE